MRGRLIVLEGADGCGKTTQTERLISWLKSQNRQVRTFREPGATPEGERIREMLLDPGLDPVPLAELFLFCASRAQNVARNLHPTLDNGIDVVLDRFFPSTLVYQGVVGQVDLQTVVQIDRASRMGLTVDLVVVLDVEPEVTISRMQGVNQPLSRQDQKGIGFHCRIRQAYLDLAERFDWMIVDGSSSVDEVFAGIKKLVKAVL